MPFCDILLHPLPSPTPYHTQTQNVFARFATVAGTEIASAITSTEETRYWLVHQEEEEEEEEEEEKQNKKHTPKYMQNKIKTKVDC